MPDPKENGYVFFDPDAPDTIDPKKPRRLALVTKIYGPTVGHGDGLVADLTMADDGTRHFGVRLARLERYLKPDRGTFELKFQTGVSRAGHPLSARGYLTPGLADGIKKSELPEAPEGIKRATAEFWFVANYRPSGPGLFDAPFRTGEAW